MLMPLVLLADSYKYAHWRCYPRGTQTIYSYLESRGGRYDHVLWFGPQYYLSEFLQGKQIAKRDLPRLDDFCRRHFGTDGVYNKGGIERLYEKHGGALPVSIWTLPEGTLVPTRVPLLVIYNTDPEFPWLTNFLETILCMLWYPTTVATQSWHMRQTIMHYLVQTGDPSLIDFKIHDFGFRGCSSVETAMIGGAAHLAAGFQGSDTIPGIEMANLIYDAGMAAFSIPATEHSTITSWGKDREVDAYRNLLDEFPKGIVACVSDSYNIYTACKDLWGDALRDKVLERDGTLVVRPDSGYPPEVVLHCLEILGERFGTMTNEKGYKVLDQHVRVIQGDGIDATMLGDILQTIAAKGWSADNVGFGCGGALLQKLDRDTQKFAFKCSAVEVDGVWRDVFKDPFTDQGKRSKAGRFSVQRRDGRLTTLPLGTAGKEELVEVFRDGQILKTWTFAEVRERAA